VVGGSRGGGGRAVRGKWDPPFRLLLYGKHCKCSNAEWHGGLSGMGAEGERQERNSGVDHGMVESLPVFQFGALDGQKAGLVCAMCLGLVRWNQYNCSGEVVTKSAPTGKKLAPSPGWPERSMMPWPMRSQHFSYQLSCDGFQICLFVKQFT
jgi:hypothetical protein